MIYYIVYCTTNLVNKKIYIGVHQTNTLEFDSYLGCGVYSTQPSTYNYPKTAFQYAVKKYGPKNFRRITIKVYDNEEDAYYLESELVTKEFLSRRDVYNQVLGGKGGDRGVQSKPCYQYDLEGNLLAEYDSQQKASLTVGRGFTTIKRAIKDKIKAAGYFWTEVKYEKLDISLYKNSDNRVPIFQYSNTGEYDCCYESISDAARVIQNTTSNIVRGIKMGYLVSNKYFSYEFSEQFSRAKTESIRGRIIYQYSLTGEYLAEYKNAAEANKAIGKSVNIGAAIKMGRTAGGFQWSLEKLDKMPNVSTKTVGKARKVGQYTKDGNLIKIYKTVTECKKDFPSCQDNLKGKTKSSGGFVFKYLE